uniref:AAA-ATPase-like domain-containing protein n=1 Tax=Ditylenchus dipsaci TaxID=166011 RepID=A0A915DV95_9BILA
METIVRRSIPDSFCITGFVLYVLDFLRHTKFNLKLNMDTVLLRNDDRPKLAPQNLSLKDLFENNTAILDPTMIIKDVFEEPDRLVAFTMPKWSGKRLFYNSSGNLLKGGYQLTSNLPFGKIYLFVKNIMANIYNSIIETLAGMKRSIKDTMRHIFGKHRQMFDQMTTEDKQLFCLHHNVNDNFDAVPKSLYVLCQLLKKYNPEKKVFILADDVDRPLLKLLDNSRSQDVCEQCCSYMQNIIEEFFVTTSWFIFLVFKGFS